jgi:hypothetical protein
MLSHINSLGDVIESETIPLLSNYDQPSITKEVIKFTSPEEIGAATSLTVNDNTLIPLYAGLLSFSPNKLNGISFYVNNILVPSNSGDYIIEDRYIYYFQDISDSIYTISYYPYFTNKQFPSPIGLKDNLYINDYDYNDGLLVNFDSSTMSESDNDELPTYLRLIMPASSENVPTVTKILNGEEYIGAPIFESSGEAQNVFSVGRKLYIECPVSLYPILRNIKYIISSNYNAIGLNPNVFEYYNTDGTFIRTSYDLPDYSHSMLAIKVIFRKNNAVNHSGVLSNLLLYINQRA